MATSMREFTDNEALHRFWLEMPHVLDSLKGYQDPHVLQSSWLTATHATLHILERLSDMLVGRRDKSCREAYLCVSRMEETFYLSDSPLVRADHKLGLRLFEASIAPYGDSYVDKKGKTHTVAPGIALAGKKVPLATPLEEVEVEGGSSRKAFIFLRGHDARRKSKYDLKVRWKQVYDVCYFPSFECLSRVRVRIETKKSRRVPLTASDIETPETIKFGSPHTLRLYEFLCREYQYMINERT